MKPGCYFINVARGSVVDQNALCNSLSSGKISFAGLDVVAPEPLPDTDPLWNFPNVLITPHVGAQAASRVPLTTDLFCMNYQRYQAGQILINQVDKDRKMPLPQHRLSVSAAGEIVLPELI